MCPKGDICNGAATEEIHYHTVQVLLEHALIKRRCEEVISLFDKLIHNY